MGQIFRDSQHSPHPHSPCSVYNCSVTQLRFTPPYSEVLVKYPIFPQPVLVQTHQRARKRILLDIPAAQSMLGNFLSGVQLSQLYTANLPMKNSVVTPCSKKSFSWFSAWFHSAALCLHMRPVSNSENTSLSAQLSTGVKRGLAKGGHMTLPPSAPRILHNHVRT